MSYYDNLLRMGYTKAQAKAIADSAPVKCNPRRKKNPVPASKKVQIRNASKLYSDFTGHEADKYQNVKKPTVPDVMVNIGEVDGIMYRTIRDGKLELYIHRFKKKAKPIFAVSHDGKQIYFIGGSYDFTELGIVDKT